ncbi:hypothetical protein BGZ59_006656 [Podila verticillata]|nr:hypothetical protein BGZ59_006656 [Podila verticillata]KAI9239977.1 MAG: hypothetical protein BYD32DRAFT_477285 [Podila humilis]KFH70581.1 hypothetical protein MVEG_03431 [Podila verticillata NRRL 6337]
MMMALSRTLTDKSVASTDSLFVNATDDGKSVTAPSVLSTTSSASSTKSSSTKSSRSRSTKSSKSSTPSIPATPNFKRTIDPLSMSSKAIGPGFMPNFNTHLFSPGFVIPEHATTKGGPKAHQTKQLQFVDKKNKPKSVNGSSSKSTKSSKTASSDKSIKSSASSTKSTIHSSHTTSGPNKSSTAPPMPDNASSKKSTPTPTSSITVTSPTNVSSPIDEHNNGDSIAETLDKLSMATAGLTRTESGHLSPHTPSPHSQRRQSVINATSELLAKRITTWEYLAKVHYGSSAFYNTIVLTEADIRAYFTPETCQKRTYQYFLLGTSLANVLDIPDIPNYTRSLATVLQEYEHFLSSESKSKMNFFKGSKKLGEEDTGEYLHFEAKNVPFELDYTVTFATLSEMVALVYKRFVTSPTSHHSMTDTELFAKIDARLKKISLTATKELEHMTRDALEDELIFLDPIGSIKGDWAHSVMAIGH